jgi:ribosomal protein S18 acetylase RimI-like enzyme
MIDIHRATSQSDLDATRTLMRAYVEWVRAASPEDKEKDDLYFDHAGFEKDLAGLPGKYDGPKGSLLIAYYDGQPVGCVASQEMDAEFSEMKRMFVSPECHGRGIGRALANRVISEAVGSGYRGIRLDTTRSLKQAVSLYESLGFRQVPAYYEIPPELEGWLVFYELKFAAS